MNNRAACVKRMKKKLVFKTVSKTCKSAYIWIWSKWTACHSQCTVLQVRFCAWTALNSLLLTYLLTYIVSVWMTFPNMCTAMTEVLFWQWLFYQHRINAQ